MVHRPCTIGAVEQTNASNFEWRLAFSIAIVAWCIGPAPSMQLGGQMPQMTNGIWHLLRQSLRGASVLHRQCSLANKCREC
jgi:hypothetical protein